MNSPVLNPKTPNLKFLSWLLFVLFITNNTNAQMTVNVSSDADALAQSLVGAGVVVSNASKNCSDSSMALFSTVGPTMGIGSGIVLTSGRASGIPQASSNFSSLNTNFPGDVDLNALVPGSTYDGCVLEFDVFVTADTLRFNYVWGSEEYPEYVGAGGTLTNYNDVFGFFISGPGITGPYSNSAINIALVPGTATPVSIGSINCQNNSPYYICNETSGTCNASYNCAVSNVITYDGQTTVLVAQAIVIPCQSYHLKLGIQDRGDGGFDSGVFIEQGSLTAVGVSVIPTATYTNPINNEPTAVEGCVNGQIKVRLSYLPTDTVAIPLIIGGTALLGIDYTYGGNDTIFFYPGDSVQFVDIVAIQDGISEPDEYISIIYQPTFCSNSPNDTAYIYISDFFLAEIIGDSVMCAGNPVSLSVNGGTLINYQWSPSTYLSCDTCQTTSANPPSDITYSVIISSGACMATDSFHISVINVTADAGPDLNLCLGDSVLLSTTLINGLSYEWFPSYGLACSTCGTTMTGTDFSLQYTVHAFAGGCDAYDDVVVNVTSPFYSLVDDSMNVCLGDSVFISAFGQFGQTYSWSPSNFLSCNTCDQSFAYPDTTTEYVITASLGSCSVSDSILIKVYGISPNAGLDVSICPWTDTTLLASGGATYLWNPASGLNNVNIPNPIANPLATTTYTVLVSTSGFVCTYADSVIVTVLPSAVATVSNDTVICENDFASLIASGGVTYSWEPSIDAFPSAFINNPQMNPIIPTTYTLIISDINACKDTANVFVDVYPAPYISITPISTIYIGESITLSASGGVSYVWSPDSNLIDFNTPNPTSTPTNTTTYFVTVTTENGCVFGNSTVVNVIGETFIAVPSAFSPNRDGTNDNFNFIVRGIFNLKNFQIFDRWGQLIFQTNNPNIGWDGIYKSQQMPIGVYVYSIEGLDVNNQTLNKSGHFSLLR